MRVVGGGRYVHHQRLGFVRQGGAGQVLQERQLSVLCAPAPLLQLPVRTSTSTQYALER